MPGRETRVLLQFAVVVCAVALVRLPSARAAATEIDEHVVYEFFDAVKDGDVATAKPLLAKYRKLVQLKTDFDQTATHVAASAGNAEMMKLLLSKGADPNALDEYGKPPILYSVAQADLEVSRALLAKGAKLVGPARTALALAVQVDSPPLIGLLLAKGAAPNQTDDEGWTPLHHAAWDGKAPAVMALLQSPKIDTNAQDLGGVTPLMLAVQASRRVGATFLTPIRAMLAKGARPELAAQTGVTAARIVLAMRLRDVAPLLGTAMGKSPPTDPPPALAAQEVATGVAHGCLRLSDSTAACWGGNAFRQAGPFEANVLDTPEAVPGLVGVAQVVTGGFHSCARLEHGRVACWGNNEQGQLGAGKQSRHIAMPFLVPNVTDVVELAAGRAFTCARTAAGEVKCWGDSRAGQCGVPETEAVLEPHQVPSVFNATLLSAGTWHACAVLGSGKTVCWGDNSRGQLGEPMIESSAAPVTVPAIGAAKELALGDRHSCVRTDDDTVRCWGDNTMGQAGSGRPVPRSDRMAGITSVVPAPTRVDGLGKVEGLSAGGGHTCALKAGAVWCWGGYGGNDARAPQSSPWVQHPANAKAIRVGGVFACALTTTDAQPLCWGAEGSLGLGLQGERIQYEPTPMKVWFVRPEPVPDP
jgi:hypothetical protein